MGLRLNREQIQLMRTALLEYQAGLRQQERYHCAGLSSVGIELCQRRLLLESILTELEHQTQTVAFPGPRPKVEPIRPANRLKVSTTIHPDYAA